MRPTLLLAVLLAAPLLRAAPEYPNRGPDIYDPMADGTTLIDAALRQALGRA